MQRGPRCRGTDSCPGFVPRHPSAGRSSPVWRRASHVGACPRAHRSPPPSIPHVSGPVLTTTALVKAASCCHQPEFRLRLPRFSCREFMGGWTERKARIAGCRAFRIRFLVRLLKRQAPVHHPSHTAANHWSFHRILPQHQTPPDLPTLCYDGRRWHAPERVLSRLSARLPEGLDSPINPRLYFLRPSLRFQGIWCLIGHVEIPPDPPP